MAKCIAVISLLILAFASAQILLYNTENQRFTEKFDCLYYHDDDTGDIIAYCQRPYRSQSLNRNGTHCYNDSQKLFFNNLIDLQVHPSQAFQWSWTIEIADLYALIFYNRSLLHKYPDAFVCNCTRSGTFGKYCEYQLTHDQLRFSQAVKKQFKQKKDSDSWNTQRYGKILCYETLLCPLSPLCLDWREICDGVQRCENGIDEENCDMLEFNECEDDEFRCANGMCIAEEFWLDALVGDFDCMDWSDEYFDGFGNLCPFEPKAMICDEHLCIINRYSCGDGECVHWLARMPFQRLTQPMDDCFNKRNLNYMCETSRNKALWTQEDGLCNPDRGFNDYRYPPWHKALTFRNLTDDEKCEYLFRCGWSRGFESDCPCDHLNCSHIMIDVCPESDRLIIYPPPRLINPNIFIFYNYTYTLENPYMHLFTLSGAFRCRGYLFQLNTYLPVILQLGLIASSRIAQVLCVKYFLPAGIPDFSSVHQYDKFCWNESLTFNGHPYAVNPDVCKDGAGECISHYRIRDAYFNCFYNLDERITSEKTYCTGRVGRQRFQCYSNERKCLPVFALGTGNVDCSNEYDEKWFGTGTSLRHQLPCFQHQTDGCHDAKTYIQDSSASNINQTYNISLATYQREDTIKIISHNRYCDTFWDLLGHGDEDSSACQQWICPKDQYKCQTGQCIPVGWVCDGEWDCSDASDEEAIVLIKQWSMHNSNLTNLSDRLALCKERYKKTPFSNKCNTSFEFGCYRSGVSNPLDIDSNHPCINLSQIGDEVEDCYNAYDERNTFTAQSTVGGMWGFHAQCDKIHRRYTDTCIISTNIICSDVLCSIFRDKDGVCSAEKDFLCIKDNQCKKNKRCDGSFDCEYGEDEYWCPSGSLANQNMYRFDKIGTSKKPITSSLVRSYPLIETLQDNQFEQEENTSTLEPQDNGSFIAHSYQCNRGIAVIELNQTTCLCPPAYFGRWCEFFTDRITVIAHLDQTTLPKIIANLTLKIKTNLFFKDQLIDQHQFIVVPTMERIKKIKYRFYLLYSRSTPMLKHKRNRYFDRSDIVNNHTYSIHFDLFTLEINKSIEEIGSWYYPIYFDYLPSHRLAVVLRFPQSFANQTFSICSHYNCNQNSTCLPVFNQNHSYYCSCKHGYYGKHCEFYEPRCEVYCSSNALCRRDDHEQLNQSTNPYCICPFNQFGPRCSLKYDGCDSEPCLNGGICHPTYDLSWKKSFVCMCSKGFYGDRCQKSPSSVHIRFNNTSISLVRAAVIQLYSILGSSLEFSIKHQQVYQDLPSIMTVNHPETMAPPIGLLKIYDHFLMSKYFLLYSLRQSLINITSSPRHCPLASSYLSQDMNPSIADVFKYHQICQNDTDRFCFHDQDYFCICEPDNYRAQCFLFPSQIDHCDKCLSTGKCIRGDPKASDDFMCLCPSCHYGHRCESSLHAFGFTLDSLLINSLKRVKIAYLSIVFLLFLIGLFNNFCSFVTFMRQVPRKVGTGNYLLIVTCLNQLALLCLLLKFISITLNTVELYSCQTISYLFSVFSRSTYWLTSCVSIDRLLLLLYPTSISLKRPCLAIGISICIFILLLGMHIHEIIYYTVIQHQSTNALMCVTNFNTIPILTYNRVSTMIHYLAPFLIQVISVTSLIVMIARSRMKIATKKMDFLQMFNKQFQNQKELYITPTIIILSALPQLILSFSFACSSFNDSQRHTLLITYLLSYVPQILGFVLFVLPSNTYKNEFFETAMAKNYLAWRSKKK
ncbi:hypothetical protein I4U23_022028 [Adineta vaga]|nr:hypothetical protein I4U23_022028 [Adineta vaga]